MDSDEETYRYDRDIVADDKNAYVSKVNSHGNYKERIVPSYEWDSIISFGAVNIANALLEGETGQSVDYDALLEFGFPLMHSLAFLGHPALIELFIRHGAPTGRRCFDKHCSDFEGMLPLNVALCPYGELRNWTPKKSLLEILTYLCDPLKKRVVDSVRVLVLHTKEAEKEISYYATERKVVELAVLLIAAREKVLATIMSQDRDGGISIYHRLWNEFVALTYEDFRHSCSNRRDKLGKMCKDKKVATMSTLMLLELFDKAGDAIEAYIQPERTDERGYPMITVEQIAQDVAWLSHEAGFVFKYPGSLRSKLHSETLKPSAFAYKAKYLVEEEKLKQNTIIGMPSQPFRFNQMTRSIHTLPASINSQTTATVEAQVMKNTIKSVDLPLPNCLLSRHWGIIALAIKRKIRTV